MFQLPTTKLQPLTKLNLERLTIRPLVIQTTNLIHYDLDEAGLIQRYYTQRYSNNQTTLLMNADSSEDWIFCSCLSNILCGIRCKWLRAASCRANDSIIVNPALLQTWTFYVRHYILTYLKIYVQHFDIIIIHLTKREFKSKVVLTREF